MIFVHIASYRDPECEPTVRDLLAKAKYPNDLRIVVILQSETNDQQHFHADNVTILSLKASQSQGACWARHLGYKLWDGEDYILQVDSHMRFVEHWDEKMLQQLNRCGVAKPLLTTYPAAYEPPNKLLSCDPVFLVAERFSIDGRLVQHGVIYHLPKSAPPRMTALMSANFVFAASDWIKDVPYDPHMYFTGEEPTLAARLWTHGWDMFGPSETVLWHRYGRFDRKLHWDDHNLWYQRDRLALERYNHLLGIPSTQDDPKIVFEIDRYGLGTERSLEQYQQFAGINFQTREIKPHAMRGDWKF